MSEFDLNFRANVSVDGESQALAEAQIAETENANRAMLSNIRQSTQIGIFALTAITGAIDQTLTLLVESLFLAIEVGLAIQAGTFGVGTVLKGGTVLSMLYLIYRIKIQKSKNNTRTQAVVSGMRLASFR